jgi:hypothetical protein
MSGWSSRVITGLFILCTFSSLPAAAQQCASKPTEKPAIAGTYMDNFGGVQVIADNFWVSVRVRDMLG